MGLNSFAKWLAHTPVEASAPCRIDMGGTLDLSTFYIPLHRLNPCTFNAALDLRTTVRLTPFDNGRIKISSRGFDSYEVDSLSAPFNHPLGLIVAIAVHFAIDGVHIQIDSASPVRSALGGSSTAAVALIWALAKTLAGMGLRPMPSPAAAAELAHAIEQSVAGVPCGLQDQLAAAFGGLNVWHWSADPEAPRYRRQIVAADWAGVDFNDCILVAYGGVPHLSKDINGAWVREFVAGHNRSDWHQMVHLSREFAAALSAGELERAQAAMNTEFDLRCRLTPAVVDDIGAQLVRTARDHGCSARFSGAGGGGCIWALGEPSRITQLRSVWQRVVARQEQARILEVKIDRDGIL